MIDDDLIIDLLLLVTAALVGWIIGTVLYRLLVLLTG